MEFKVDFFFISFSDVLAVYKKNIRIVSVQFFFDGIQVHVDLLWTYESKALGSQWISGGN